jgi:hypothetical protein
MEEAAEEEGVPAESEASVVAAAEQDSATPTGEAVSATSDQVADEEVVETSAESGVCQPEPDPPSVGEGATDDGTALSDGADECAVCLCVLCDPVELGCGHTFWCVPRHTWQNPIAHGVPQHVHKVPRL